MWRYVFFLQKVFIETRIIEIQDKHHFNIVYKRDGVDGFGQIHVLFLVPLYNTPRNWTSNEGQSWLIPVRWILSVLTMEEARFLFMLWCACTMLFLFSGILCMVLSSMIFYLLFLFSRSCKLCNWKQQAIICVAHTLVKYSPPPPQWVGATEATGPYNHNVDMGQYSMILVKSIYWTPKKQIYPI